METDSKQFYETANLKACCKEKCRGCYESICQGVLKHCVGRGGRIRGFLRKQVPELSCEGPGEVSRLRVFWEEETVGEEVKRGPEQ